MCAAYDFWVGERSARADFGQYTVNTYMDRVDTIIAEHAIPTSPPLFLYYAEQQLHVPIELPQDPKHVQACTHVTGGSAAVNRTELCAMASQLDESIGRLVSSLKTHGLWNNTLIWAVSDNGGMTHWGDLFPASASSNWPLRGGKATVFEGGVRSVSFLAGGVVPKSAEGSVYTSLVHVTDIMLTLAPLAGVTVPSEVGFDGVDLWKGIIGESSSVRRMEVPLNVDTSPFSLIGDAGHLGQGGQHGEANFSALIQWPWKLVYGVTCYPGHPNADLTMDGWWPIKNYSRILPPPKSTDGPALLFNLELDEGEHEDLAASHPDVVRDMTDRLQNYWASKEHGFVRAQFNLPLPLGNPRFHNWSWSPFRPSIRHSKWAPPAFGGGR